MDIIQQILNDDILLIENKQDEPIKKIQELTNEKEEQQTDKDIKYKLYKIEYNKKRYIEKKELILNQQKTYYINKIQNDPAFRNILNDKTKARYKKKKQEEKTQGKETRPRGRPKTKEQTEKKANGRPRKYNTI